MAQQVKDLALSLLWLWFQLWLGFHSWLENFCMPWGQPKKKKQSLLWCSGLRIQHCLCGSMGLIPTPVQWVKNPTSVAPIWPPALEFPYAAGAVLKKKKKKKKGIQHYCSCRVGHICSLDPIPGPGTSIYCGCSIPPPKKKPKKTAFCNV